jgi:hypothetical protein
VTNPKPTIFANPWPLLFFSFQIHLISSFFMQSSGLLGKPTHKTSALTIESSKESISEPTQESYVDEGLVTTTEQTEIDHQITDTLDVSGDQI